MSHNLCSPRAVLVFASSLVSLLLAAPRPLTAQQPEPPAPRPLDVAVSKFLSARCAECHTGAKPKGDFVVDKLNADFAVRRNRDRWLAVAEQLRAGVMPPPESPRPPRDEVNAVLDWIGQQLAANQRSTTAGTNSTSTARRAISRRLSPVEYVNTVRDLLAVDIDLKDLFPPDTSANGFDTNAENLHVSSYLMDHYLKAAERLVDAAIVSSPRPPTQQRRLDIKNEKSIKPKGSVYRHLDDGVAIFSSWVSANIQVTLWQFQTRARGKYRFRISGYGYQTQKPVTFHVMAGPMNAAAQQFLLGYYDVPPNEPRVVEFVESLDAQHTIRIIADKLGAIPPEVEKIGAENYQGPGLVVQWVDVEGPLIDEWPPASHRRLVGDLPQRAVASHPQPGRLELVSNDPLADADRILRTFARRAFRRPVVDADLQPYLARLKQKLAQGASFDEALRIALRSILVSSDFLFLREPVGPLDDFALASRLSYFLWSSMPDDELFAIAERGELRKPEVLRAQVERMLRDPKGAGFTQNFAGQWLGLRAIDATMPDPMLYPEFDDVLKVSCVQETLLFFDEVLKHDLSVTNFVAADFAMLNGRLAEHYGIPGVEGFEFRKVNLPGDGRRGGLLTMASILKVTANGTTTSPVLRGAWVLDRILGTPPPKPTVDVEAVEPDIRGATTIREQLAKHRGRAECASCHALIDPPGFALENYDVIGGWRERYRSVGAGDPVVVDGRKRRYLHGKPVDSADTLSDGRSFQNIAEFKRLLASDPDQLARNLAEKLLSYGTGTTTTLARRAAVEKIVGRVREQNHGFRALVHEVVQSPAFQDN